MMSSVILKILVLLIIFSQFHPAVADEWQGIEHARKRILEIRKARLTVRVVDQNENPVQDARVSIEMKRHAFPFGCAISATQAFTGNGVNPEMATYLDVFRQHFNSAVMENAMKWYGMSHDDGTPDMNSRKKMWQCVEWLEQNNIPLRGHNGLWASWRFSPDYLKDLELQPEKLRVEVNNRIDEVVSMFKGKLSDWDLVNEPAHHRDIMNIFGEDIVIEWYKRAHQIDPETPMYVNQWAVLNDVYHNTYLEWVKRLTSSPEASLDGIGLQGHMTVEYFLDQEKMALIWQKLDQYAEFGLPIKITEFDIEGYKGEDLQAKALENALTLFFSHPAIQGFTLWGFWDGRHWRNNPKWSMTGESDQAGFWNLDWSEKPAAKVWQELIFKQWWTKESGLTFGKDASYATRGFLGDYEIIVNHRGNTKTVPTKLTRTGATILVRMP